jgi:cytochrome c oxidase accessory protein FixG
MGLVAQREMIYPADNKGRFRTARKWVGGALIAFFIVTPFLSFGGLPAVRIDLPGRRLIMLGQLFTPHDTWALALLLLIFALTIMLFTAILGRVWCGWACPQTVWLEWVYRPIERFFEGPAHRRARRDKKGRTPEWWRIKVAKHAAFTLVTFGTTCIFLSWFVGGPQLLMGQFGAGTVTVGVFLFALFYADAAWFREQMCNYACPYARFQGVLMDKRSLVVAYDVARGEPRTKKKDEGGDCIDCNRCVSVCPGGVDIREGDQLQCIACAGCIDACDEIMIKIGKPTGLIRYTTKRDERASEGEWRPHLKNPRVYAYAAILTVLSLMLMVGLATRNEVVFWAARSAGDQLYLELPNGTVANQFHLHVTNRDTAERSFTVESLTEGVEVTAPGQPWRVEWGAELRVPGFIAASPTAFERGRKAAELKVVRDDGQADTVTITLLGPAGPAKEARR